MCEYVQLVHKPASAVDPCQVVSGGTQNFMTGLPEQLLWQEALSAACDRILTALIWREGHGCTRSAHGFVYLPKENGSLTTVSNAFLHTFFES